MLMIGIGWVASLSVGALFTAGFAPAVVLAVALMVYVWWLAGKSGIAPEPVPTAGALGRAVWRALIPRGIPAIIFGGILGGIMSASPVPALGRVQSGDGGPLRYR